MPELIVGSPPRGEDYFGREDLIDRLWRRLENDSVLLAAPRRFGKTGAMLRLLDDPRPPFKPIFIDVENITSAADFMVELLAAMLRDRYFARLIRGLWDETRELGRFLRNLPSKLDIGGLKIELREKTDVNKSWPEYGEQVMTLFAREPLLLMIDEFAIMMSEIEKREPGEAAQFLRWFRRARITPGTRARFVLGSSVNLITTLDGMGLVDTVNDLWIEKLGAFSRRTAGDFVDAIFDQRQISISKATRKVILDSVGEPIPYLLSVFLTAILDRHRATGKPVTAKLVRAALEKDLLGGATAAVFHHYRSRLDEYYSPDDARAARALLALLSRSEEPVSESTLYALFLETRRLSPGPDAMEEMTRLMNQLENDFYIVSRDFSYNFFSRVLRLWWRAKYSYQGI